MKVAEKKDKTGRVEELAFYDDAGKPVLNGFGFAKKTKAYDAAGNVIEERFYGVAGEPVLCKVHRCARIATAHRVTDNGSVVEARYYGLAGEPVKDAYGTAGRVWVYDAHRRPTEDIRLGLSDEPVVHQKDGCATTRRSFDARHRIVEERYYGAAGEPVTQKVHGFAKITWTYRGTKAEKLYHQSLQDKGQAVSSETSDKLERESRTLHGRGIGDSLMCDQGVPAAAEGQRVSVDMNRLICRHCAILGETGSGKTNAVRIIVKAFAEAPSPFKSILIVDPQGEYADGLPEGGCVFRAEAGTQADEIRVYFAGTAGCPPDACGQTACASSHPHSAGLAHDPTVRIIDLSAVPSDRMAAIYGDIIKSVHDGSECVQGKLWESSTHPLLVVFEGIDACLAGGDETAASGLLQVIMKEGAKSGTGVVLVAQSPARMARAVLGQCGSIIAFKMTEDCEAKCVTVALPADHDQMAEVLPGLKTGEAVITGEAVTVPAMMTFNHEKRSGGGCRYMVGSTICDLKESGQK